MTVTRRSLPSALGVSVAIHAGLLAVLLLWAGLRPQEVATKTPPIRTDLVYLQHTGPGGGGGGNPAPAPPRPAQIPPHRTPQIAAVAVETPVEPPKPTLDIQVQSRLADVLTASGTRLGAPPGPGGGGRGSGAGPGDGSGLNDGRGGNQGGGPRGIGDGVTILEVKPQYTGGALTAKIQGSVTLEVVVRADGTVGDIKVIASLDRVHGLDMEAIKAARQWRFKPGLFQGKPVDVIVRIILDFNLR
jgi:protein TonB